MPLLSQHLTVLRSAQLVAEHLEGASGCSDCIPSRHRELYDRPAVFTNFWKDRRCGLYAYLKPEAEIPAHSRPITTGAGDQVRPETHMSHSRSSSCIDRTNLASGWLLAEAASGRPVQRLYLAAGRNSSGVISTPGIDGEGRKAINVGLPAPAIGAGDVAALELGTTATAKTARELVSLTATSAVTFHPSP